MGVWAGSLPRSVLRAPLSNAWRSLQAWLGCAGKRGDDASEPGSAVETLVAFALFGGVGFFTYRATSVPGSAGFRLRRQLARHLRVL